MQWREARLLILNRMVRVGFSGEVTFEKRLKGMMGLIMQRSEGETVPAGWSLPSLHLSASVPYL